MRTKFFWVLAACWILFLALVFGLVLFPKAVPFVGIFTRNIRVVLPLLFFTTVVYGVYSLYRLGMKRARR